MRQILCPVWFNLPLISYDHPAHAMEVIDPMKSKVHIHYAVQLYCTHRDSCHTNQYRQSTHRPNCKALALQFGRWVLRRWCEWKHGIFVECRRMNDISPGICSGRQQSKSLKLNITLPCFAAIKLLASGSAAFVDVCAPIGWKGCHSVISL